MNRREFVRSAVLGAAAAAASRRLPGKAATTGLESPGSAHQGGIADVFALFRPGGPLVLASDLGCPMIKNGLGSGSGSEIALMEGSGVPTQSGLMVEGGEAILGARALPTPGNRSTYARVAFAFDSPQSTVELRLVTTHRPIQGKMLLPLRARLSGGRFVLLGLNDGVIAGDRNKVVFTPHPGQWHTLELVTFQKSVQARISGCDAMLRLPDRLRFIPGDPGLRLLPAPGSRVYARDWLVTAVGPRAATLGAIGDSITAGTQTGPEAEDYVHLITRALGQDYILNAGSGGATTGQDRARFRYEIAPFRPRLVWIESGTNDLTHGLTAGQIHANQLATAAQIDWDGKAVLSTVPPCREYGPALREERRKLNELIRRGNLPFVDRARICESSRNHEQLRPDFDSGDGIHPNAKGSIAIAAAAAPVFRRLVQGGQMTSWFGKNHEVSPVP